MSIYVLITLIELRHTTHTHTHTHTQPLVFILLNMKVHVTGITEEDINLREQCSYSNCIDGFGFPRFFVFSI